MTSEIVARHGDRAEACEMLGQELRVEQPEASRPQPRDEMHERHLGGVAGAVKHALAEEDAAKAHAVEAAHERAALVRLDRMGVARAVKAGDRAGESRH